MKYKLFTKTRKFRSALLADIQNAKKSIYIEMYSFFGNTHESHDFVQLLIQKAKKGIKVVLIFDAFGSRELKNSTIKTLKSAGIELHFFSDWLRRTHRKIMIIDSQIAFFGGANITKHSSHRYDLQIRLKGRTIIKPLIKSFAYTYKMCGGQNKTILALYKKSFIKKIETFLIENFPGHKDYRLTEYYKENIIKAQKSIKLTTPYFMPPRWLIALLDDAVRRGVKVEIIIPYNTDFRTLDKINFYHIGKYNNLGIHFYAMPQMNHAKMMLIDDTIGVIGSQNLDMLSFGQNIELGGFFTHKKLVKHLGEIFETWKRKSQSYKKKNISLNIKDRILGRFMHIIFYFM